MTAASSRLIAREALAEFIRDAAKSIKEAYWFVLRGECDVSLCTHTLLSKEEYSEVLYHAELISRGKKGYQYSEETWRVFLRDYGLFGSGELSIAEVTHHRAFTHNLKTPGSTNDLTTRKDLLFLRIGEYDEDGLTTNPWMQLKHNKRPPDFNYKLRTAGRKLKLAVREIIGTIDSDISDAIVEWCDMPALREFDEDDNGSIEGSEGTNNNSEAANTSNAAPVVPQNTSTTETVSTNTTIPSATDNVVPVVLAPPANSPTHNPKYPLLSSLNIDLLNRSEGAAGYRSQTQMSNLLREIIAYQTDNDEFVGCKGGNSRSEIKL